MGKRSDPFLLGVAEGSMKRGLDKVTEPISLPIAEAILSKLKEMNPSLEMTAPMVQTLCSSMIIMGLGELAEIAAPHLPENVSSKVAQGAVFGRKYAGEKFGKELVDFAILMMPLLMQAFSQVTVMEMLNVNESHQDESLGEKPESLLLDEDEGENAVVLAQVQVEEPVRKRKR